MFTQTVVCLSLSVLGQVDAQEPRLETILRNPARVYTEFDVVEVDVYLVADEKILSQVGFCAAAEAIACCVMQFLDFVLNPELQFVPGLCLFLMQRQDELFVQVVGGHSLLCPTTASIAQGRIRIGTLRLVVHLAPPEEPTPVTIRVGGCQRFGADARAFFGPSQELSTRLQDAEPITVTIQRRPFIRGDVNLDDTLDISDPILIAWAIFFNTEPSLPCRNAADTNDDSRVDLSDVIYLASYLFLGTPAPPLPFPEPGYDRNATSPDNTGCRGP
jgi:hypothetical protein